MDTLPCKITPAEQEFVNVHPYISVSHVGKVFLMLPGKEYKEKRCLGYIDRDCFHCLRNPHQHIYGTQRALGFNWELMRDGKFDFAVIHTPFGRDVLIASRSKIIRDGKFLEFANNKLEKQIFLPLSEFKINQFPSLVLDDNRKRPAKTQMELSLKV